MQVLFLSLTFFEVFLRYVYTRILLSHFTPSNIIIAIIYKDVNIRNIYLLLY